MRPSIGSNEIPSETVILKSVAIKAVFGNDSSENNTIKGGKKRSHVIALLTFQRTVSPRVKALRRKQNIFMMFGIVRFSIKL